MRYDFPTLLGVALCASALALPVSAQRDGGGAASSQTFVMPSSETSSGGSSASTVYKLTASFGAGVVADSCTSTTYKLVGGFTATLDTPLGLRPWLTSVLPLYAPFKGGIALRLAGTNLHLGANAGVKIGGQVATVGSRGRAFINVTVPAQKVPGWQPVEVSVGGQTSTLPKGLGILPLLDIERAAIPGIPFSVTYRGTPGDAVVWLVSGGSLSHPIPLAGFGYHFALDLFTITAVMSPTGKTDLFIPGVPWARPLAMQALGLSTNAGYAPGCFTNVVKL